MSLEQELQTELVAHLDLAGFSRVVSGHSVRDTLAQMRQDGFNVCLITQEERLVGIFTDRDVLRRVATAPETWDRPIDEVMTPNPIAVKPDTSAAEALWLMDEKHVRNLPVVGEEGIVGNMTHRAVIDFLAARYATEVLNRPLDAERFPRKQEGG